MKSKNKILIALSFLIFGVLSLLSYTETIHISTEEAAGIVFILYGTVTVYKTFGANNRGALSFAVIVFLVGITLIIKTHFDLLDSRGIVFTSILFIGGATFLMLFLENTKTKAFLYAGLSLVALSIITVTLLKQLGLFSFTNRIGNYFEYFWPVVLILFGISLFANRKK